MREDKRPYIEFERVKNVNIPYRPARPAEIVNGVVLKKAKPELVGEKSEVWRKSLTNRIDNSPYSWVGADWVMGRISSGCRPIGMGNIENLPADYPKEWRRQIMECINLIKSHVETNQRMRAVEAEIAEREAALKARLEKLEAASAEPAPDSDAQGKTPVAVKAKGKQAEAAVEKHS